MDHILPLNELNRKESHYDDKNKLDINKLPAVTMPPLVIYEEASKPVKEKPKKKNVCNHQDCRKKLGAFPLECKCGLAFCGTHRYSDTHDCTFDHKAHNKKILENNMVKLTKSKLDKI